MRQLLSSRRGLEERAGPAGGSREEPGGEEAETSILASENQSLRQRCQQLEDDCQDAHM